MERMLYEEDLRRNSSYSIVKKLGEGTQGIVILIKKDEELYAAKVFKYLTGYMGRSFDLNIGDSNPLFEINFGLKVKHPYIIEGIELIIGQRYIFYVMKKADIDLGHFLLVNKFSPTEKIQNIFKLACGFDYIHQSGFIHGDIKSINILLNKDRDNVFIGDFGLISLVDDKDPNKPFQTINYRPPENILPNKETDMPLNTYREIFDEDILKTQRTNFRLGEAWSFGVLCLDIMYNTPNITLSPFINKCSLISRNDIGKYNFPYNTFINILSKLYDLERYPEVAEENTFTLVKKILGEVSKENQDLLKLICEKLLIVDQSKRSTIQDFIQSDFFYSKGLITHSNINHFNYYHVENMYIQNDRVPDILKNLKILTDWLVEIYNDLELGLIILMNTIDYIIQRNHIFINTIKDIQLFGLCAMWIMTRLYNYEVFIDISLIINLTKCAYTQIEILNMILSILKYEKGLFEFESLYFQLPSEQLLIKGVKTMIDISSYIEKYTSPKQLSRELLKNESHEEMKNRLPRSYNYIYF